MRALWYDPHVPFQVRDSASPLLLEFDIHLERILADEAGIGLIGAIGLICGAVNSSPRTNDNLLTKDGGWVVFQVPRAALAEGEVANLAYRSSLHPDIHQCIAAGTEPDWSRTAG